MKLSDYVACFLRDQGIEHAFVLSGGACMHLIDSIARTDGIDHVCCLHEQANAMAADAYARVKGLGVAISTSGPGATNMFTGIACSYYDSIPTLFITGQQVSTRLKGTSGVRQIGFQETSTVEMAQHITKAAVQLRHPNDIRFQLERLIWTAKEGRAGPVLLDLPDDFQRAEVDPDALVGFHGIDGYGPIVPPILDQKSEAGALGVLRVVEAIRRAERPIFIPGFGCRLAGSADLVVKVAERYGLPIAPTWSMVDAIPADHPLLVGRFGTHGLRGPNFAVANADLILAVGTRLDSHATGNSFTSFARGARTIVVDIDPAEVAKFGDQVEGIVADAGDFLRAMLVATISPRQIAAKFEVPAEMLGRPNWRPSWNSKIADWNARYPLEPVTSPDQVDPIVLFKALSRHAPDDATIVLDTGCTLAWFFQAFEPKPGQRIHHDFNNTAMGWALPASIGASLALGRKPVICICGDGGLQMNIQELATVAAMDLPIKILCLNNRGHGMTRQTQDQWFEGRHEATGREGGLPTPHLWPLVTGMGINRWVIERSQEIDQCLMEWLDRSRPAYLEALVPVEAKVSPQLRFGRPIEDAEPLLPRDEFLAQMIVEPWPISKESIPV